MIPRIRLGCFPNPALGLFASAGVTLGVGALGRSDDPSLVPLVGWLFRFCAISFWAGETLAAGDGLSKLADAAVPFGPWFPADSWPRADDAVNRAASTPAAQSTRKTFKFPPFRQSRPKLRAPTSKSPTAFSDPILDCLTQGLDARCGRKTVNWSLEREDWLDAFSPTFSRGNAPLF